MTRRRRAYLGALFAVYLVLLVWAVLWKLAAPWVGADRIVKVVPFLATSAAGPSAPVEVVVNLVLFVPFGLYLGLLASRQRWWTAAGVVASASLALEAGQYALGVGRSDTTDLVTNTAGGLAGLALCALVRHRLGVRTAGVVTRVCSVGTALVLLGGGLYVAAFGPVVHVGDVGPLAGTVSSSGHL